MIEALFTLTACVAIVLLVSMISYLAGYESREKITREMPPFLAMALWMIVFTNLLSHGLDPFTVTMLVGATGSTAFAAFRR